MIQLINIARAWDTDHSNPMRMFHGLIFVDSEQELGNENRSIIDGDLYRVQLSGCLDQNAILEAFKYANVQKERGIKWDGK